MFSIKVTSFNDEYNLLLLAYHNECFAGIKIYTMQNIFSNFFMSCNFCHHPSVTLSKFKLQKKKRREQYLGHEYNYNYRSLLFHLNIQLRH